MWVNGNSTTPPNNEKPDVIVNHECVRTSTIDANNADREWLVIDEHFAYKPDVFDANFWPMSGKKFVSSEFDLVLAGGIESNSGETHSESGCEQQPSIAREPLSVVGKKFVSGFLPFLQGFVVDCGILLLAATVILWDKKC